MLRVRSVSSTTRSNAKKSSSWVKSTLRPTPRLSTWKTILPGECRLGRDIHGFLSRHPSFVNLVAVTFSALAIEISSQGECRVGENHEGEDGRLWDVTVGLVNRQVCRNAINGV